MKIFLFSQKVSISLFFIEINKLHKEKLLV